MEDTNWKIFTDFVNKEFGIDKITLDYIAVKDILFGCVVGLSNNTISRKYNLDIEYVKEVLGSFLAFDGWNEDLDINTYHIYNTSGKELSTYELTIKIFTALLTKEEIYKSFEMCSKYDTIVDEIERYYNKGYKNKHD